MSAPPPSPMTAPGGSMGMSVDSRTSMKPWSSRPLRRTWTCSVIDWPATVRRFDRVTSTRIPRTRNAVQASPMMSSRPKT